jgi:hypothetical protein
MIQKLLTPIVLLTAMSACTTPYKEFGTDFWSGYGGYQDHKVRENEYLVTFRGNGNTTIGQCQSYAYRRARELCDSYDVISSASPSIRPAPVFEVTVRCR